LWRPGKKDLGFLCLLTDSKGTYWFTCSRGFHTSLNESLASVETLIDELGDGEDGDRGSADIKQQVNQIYRRLSDYLEDVSMWTRPPYHRFTDFLAPGADRYSILGELVEELEFGYSSIALDTPEGHTSKGRPLRHFFVLPKREQALLPGNLLTVLAAHYDRAAGSPGANDNSAAVFMLLEAALKLREEGQQNALIIFTDKEELSPGEGIREQGSYGLSLRLRETALRDCRYYIFDTCGTGDTLIISTMADHLLKHEGGHEAAKRRWTVNHLRDDALQTARNMGMEKVLLAPTPFSDDAGFLRAGLAAQTITMLPAPEAAGLASLLRTKPECINALISREAQTAGGELPLPETWRIFNSPDDSPERLTPQNFSRVVKFACALCRG
jgi:hypothetical protein